MKKSLCILTIVLFVVMLTVTVQAGERGCHNNGSPGKSSISIKTQTSTNLDAGTFRGYGTSGGFMSAEQAGKVSLKASGKGSGEGGYDTGYLQTQKIPGGSQSMYGEQWGSVKVNQH